MIEAQGLRKSFGSRRAVDGLSFTARDGEITGLLGPNGAGKTTTLRMLETLLRPDAGTIHVDGRDARREPLAVRRSLGALPDARGLYTRLTARENIEYFALLHGLERARARARADELIEALGMQEFGLRRTAGFSQGERVKTAIARALVHDPRNLLLDEPTNGLDVAATRGLREFLRGLRAAGRCVLLSTHLMQEVAALCDRIVVMAHGRVIADGTPDELRQLAGEPSLEDAFMRLIDAAGTGGEPGAGMGS
jgi:sodium transport system ATP-binding protein